MRVVQKPAAKGSQKWIQDIINGCPELINARIQKKITSLFGREIRWTSPLEQDEFAEYRETAFLKNINLQELSEELNRFWPKNGPQWDALGSTPDEPDGRALILVEAKANVPELVSFCGAKDKESLKIISASLDETKQWLNCRDPHIDWKCGFYQYANRLAHLYFFREKHQKEAYLIFLYFLNDENHIATSREAWDCALQLQKKLMGLSIKSLSGKVIDIFIDIKDIEEINKRTGFGSHSCRDLTDPWPLIPNP